MPNNQSEIHYNLGLILQDKGQIEEAIEQLREAIYFNPNHADAHFRLGVILDLEQSQLEEAIAEYREAVRINPNEATYHSILGGALEQQAELSGNLFERRIKLDEAISEYQEAIRLYPDDAATYMFLGRAIGLADREKAKEALQKSKELFIIQGYDEALKMVNNYLDDIGYSPDDC